jgi:quercetin dioxygenase-like cupin family protein
MKRVSLPVLLVAAALVAACGGGAVNVAVKPSAPPAPVTKYKNTLSGQTASGPIDLIQSILYFAPGAASAVHKHPTPFLATVLQGQITLKTPSGDKQSSAGEVILEPLNQPVQAVNMGSVDAMTVVAYPVAHGGKPTVAVAGSPAPAIPNKTLYSFTLDSPSVTGPYSLVQQELDFAPGSQTAKHQHGGPGVITVLQGQVTLNRDGTEKTYNVGESFSETPGQTLQAFNRGGTELIVAATYLLPDGAQLTTNV